MKPTKNCSFPGCDKPHMARGLCSGHWQQNRKGQELRPLQHSSQGLPLDQRFWAKVKKTPDCWEWTASTKSRGYGRITDDGRLRYAHRVAWEMANGPIPDSMDLDHKCGNRACVRPTHLRVTTRSQNGQHRTVANKNNASGVRGVTWSKDKNAWRVHVRLNGSQYWGGYHSTLEAADKAARALRAKLHTHDDHHEWVGNQTEGGTR